jgi:hypothetical protein
MQDKASMDPETWMYYFGKFDQSAKEGRYLPTLEDIYCGMSLFGRSVAADAQEWSKHMIPHLAEKGQKIPRNKIQLALERLTVSASLEDLKFVHDEIVYYESPPEILEAVSYAVRRLVYYRVASGDKSMIFSLVDDLMFKIRWLTCVSAG